jgi:pilus assembly protein CpaB
MNRRLLTILLVAFVLAALCTFLVVRLVHNQVSARPTITTTRLVAAKADIKLGTLLSADNIDTVEVSGTGPKDAILEKNKASIIGRGVISDIYAGEPIIEDRLAGGKNGGLSAAIPIGMRACAVRVDEVVGVSGFATPGMRVDVLISGTPPGEQDTKRGTESRTLLQNIQVLSAGTEYQKDAEGKAKPAQVVNLLVTPEQAETLSLATNQVTIRLVLRNPMDTKTDPVMGTATSNLFGGPTAAPTATTAKPRRVETKAAAPKPYSIEVMNGNKTSEEKFASPEGHQ